MEKLPKTAIIGLGNMGEALLAGILSKKLADPADLVGVEALAERAGDVAKSYGIKVTSDPAEAAAQAEMVIIAVKPKDATAVLKKLGGGEGKLIVSICAGLTLNFFESRLKEGARVVRVMPNTPALVGEGASVYVASRTVDADSAAAVELLLSGVGYSVRVEDEKLMDAVTGLSGSGPAYVFIMIEALADGGVASGLPRELAFRLAAQTVLGSALMALGGVAHTAELKDRVCSPGGTTIEGVRKLEEGGFRSALIEAVRAATARSRELGG